MGILHRLVPGHAVAAFAGPGRIVWRVQSPIEFLASPGRTLPEWCTQQPLLMRGGSFPELVLRTTWDRLPPVSQGHASQLNIWRSGADPVGLC